MPCMTGMRISVSSNSKGPWSRTRASSASPPSFAVMTSWPSCNKARVTRPRIASSSSTIRIRANSPSRNADAKVATVEEPRQHVAGLGRWRGQPSRRSVNGSETMSGLAAPPPAVPVESVPRRDCCTGKPQRRPSAQGRDKGKTRPKPAGRSAREGSGIATAGINANQGGELSLGCGRADRPSENDVVRFENVGLRYGVGPEILRDLTVRIDSHSFQFLTGPSGAGKTSLLRMLFLSLRPTRGLITLFGHDIAKLGKDALATLRRRIGIVFQDFRLLDHMTTYENVALPFRVMGRTEESFREEVVELLHWVGLGDRMWALPPILSGGEKQRAAIARAVIARPQLLLADEPTGNVDPNHAQRLLRLFIELNKSGTSVLLATHDIALMDPYAARRIPLHEERLPVSG